MEFMDKILEDIILGTWKFSCEATQKHAEKIAKDLFNFRENKESEDPVLEELFPPETKTPSSATSEADDFDYQAPECDAWINIDELNINDDVDDNYDEEIQEPIAIPMETNKEIVEPEKVEDVDNIKTSDDEQQVSELVIVLQQSEGSCLSPEVSERLKSLSETLLSSLLVTLRNSASETPLVSLCLTVCENMGLREQSFVATLLCSQALLAKAQEAELKGPLLAATSRLAINVPAVVASRLLLPLLLAGEESYARACHLVDMCDSEELRHALLRSWLDDRGPQFTESDLELLKLLLKTPAKDPDTIRKLCAMFGQVGPSFETNTNFSKLLLQTIKSIARGSLGGEAKQHLNTAVAANKSGLKKMLERTLANI